MSVGKPHPPEIRERAHRLADEGQSAKWIAHDLGVPLKTVRNWLPTGIARPRFSAADRARAVEMHRQGTPPAEIARALGAHPSTVTYWLKNVRAKARKPHSPETVRRVLARLDSGSTPEEAARAFGVPKSTIQNWLAQRDSEAMTARLYGADRRARYAIYRPALALALSGVWR